MRRPVLVSLGLCLALFALAACGDDDQAARTTDDSSTTTTTNETSTSATSTTAPTGRGDHATSTTARTTTSGLVITVDTAGGFVPVEYQVGNTADLVLLGDGSLITGAPTIAIYPGPALPAFQVGHVAGDDVRSARRAVEALDPDASYAQPGPGVVADAPDTIVTLSDGKEHIRISANALGMGEEKGAHAKLQAVVEQLQALDTGNGEQPYAPTALRVHDVTDRSGPRTTAAPPEPSGRVLDWPISHTGAACSVVRDGKDVQAVLAVLQHATQLDWFQTVVGERRLVVVPLLPGDPGCAKS